LAGHEVHTVEEAGIKGLENGDLLKAESGLYEVLITVDQNLPYQQNIAGLNIATLILAAKKNSYVRLKPLIPRALTGAIQETDASLLPDATAESLPSNTRGFC
jgi:hypothetical protein